MQVKTIIPHGSADGQEHKAGHVYELTGIELELRLKDRIVCDSAAVPTPEPTVAAAIASVRATEKEEDDPHRLLPPSNPEE